MFVVDHACNTKCFIYFVEAVVDSAQPGVTSVLQGGDVVQAAVDTAQGATDAGATGAADTLESAGLQSAGDIITAGGEATQDITTGILSLTID